MTPASPSIYKCPDCQNETRIFRGHIGPQFRNISRLWSDMSSISETISYKISPIIECSHCGHFFMMNGDGIISPDNDVKLGKRDWVSKPKIEDIYREVTERGLNKNQKFVLLLNMIQDYNWNFHHIKEESLLIPTAERKQLYQSNLLELIRLLKNYGVNAVPLIAEFYREAGMFEECIETLEDFNPPTDYIKDYCNQIKQKAIIRDDKVFELELPKSFIDIKPLSFISEPYKVIAHLEPFKLSNPILNEGKLKKVILEISSSS